jgi:hypothetical protein
MASFSDMIQRVGSDVAMAMFAAPKGGVFYVDGTVGSDTNNGSNPKRALKTIQKAVDKSIPGGVVFVAPKKITALATDPVSYAETVIVPNALAGLTIMGVGNGITQGGLPQVKIGAGTTAMFDIHAPGVRMSHLGINGASSTGGGIKLTDDGGVASASFGVVIDNCHFKNCACHATNGTLGGAIYSTGSPWQIRIVDNVFYKNLAGIVMVNTSYSVPQDWVIENNVFNSSVKTDVDVDIYAAADGIKGLVIRNNEFATVDVPTKGSGSVGKYISLGAGTSGSIDNNHFACIVGEADSQLTFGAAGTAAVIPTTVRISASNTGETSDTAAGSLDTGHVYRTD